jgi:cytidine deaminase
MKRVALTEGDRELLRKAVETSDHLYRKKQQEVAAAVRTAGGEVFAAIHFETKVGYATVCGEVAAICCMVAAGHRDLDTIVAVWRDPQGRHFLLPPCGRCRDVISEFNPRAWVIISRRRDFWDPRAIGKPCKVRVSDLLPASFGSDPA